MHRLPILLLSAMILFLNTGCLSVRSYLDPRVPRISYDELVKESEPIRLRVVAEFKRNGSRLPEGDALLQDRVERVLRATGVIVPTVVAGEAQGVVRVTINNVGNVPGAMAAGVGTGLTMGLVGSTVQDRYELSMSISVNGKTMTREGLHVDLFTSIGNTSVPPGAEPLPLDVAFSQAIEQLLLRAIRDMQRPQADETSQDAPTASIPVGVGSSSPSSM